MKKIRLIQPLPFIFRTGDDDMGVSMYSMSDAATKASSYVLSAGYQENEGPLRTAIFGRLVDLSPSYKSIRDFLESMTAGYVISEEFFSRPTVKHVLTTLEEERFIEIIDL